MSSQFSARSLPRGFIRTSTKPPESRVPCSGISARPAARAGAGSPSGSQVPRSQVSTVPAPYCLPGWCRGNRRSRADGPRPARPAACRRGRATGPSAPPSSAARRRAPAGNPSAAGGRHVLLHDEVARLAAARAGGGSGSGVARNRGGRGRSDGRIRLLARRGRGIAAQRGQRRIRVRNRRRHAIQGPDGLGREPLRTARLDRRPRSLHTSSAGPSSLIWPCSSQIARVTPVAHRRFPMSRQHQDLGAAHHVLEAHAGLLDEIPRRRPGTTRPSAGSAAGWRWPGRRRGGPPCRTSRCGPAGRGSRRAPRTRRRLRRGGAARARPSPLYRPRSRMFSRPVRSGFMPRLGSSSAFRLPWTRSRPITGS